MILRVSKVNRIAPYNIRFQRNFIDFIDMYVELFDEEDDRYLFWHRSDAYTEKWANSKFFDPGKDPEVFPLASNDYRFIFQIPQREIQLNGAISESDQNPFSGQ